MNKATEIELIKLHLRETDDEETDYRVVKSSRGTYYLFACYIDKNNKDSWRLVDEFDTPEEAREFVKEFELSN